MPTIRRRGWAAGGGLALAGGQLGLTECSERELPGWLARLAPAELLHDGSALPDACATLRATRTARPAWQFDAALGLRKLCEQLQVASLQAFGAQELAVAQAAAGALVQPSLLLGRELHRQRRHQRSHG